MPKNVGFLVTYAIPTLSRGLSYHERGLHIMAKLHMTTQRLLCNCVYLIMVDGIKH